jgi:GNAT superfamily N-acetyltransferase
MPPVPTWLDLAAPYLGAPDYRWGDRHIIRPYAIPTPELPPGPIRNAGPFAIVRCERPRDSPHVMAAALVLRAAFCREFRDTDPFAGYEATHPYLIFKPDEEVRWVVGALDFLFLDARGGEAAHPAGHAHLCWAYLHPDFRGRGVLTAALRHAHADLGDFTTEKPIAPAMLRVLRKIGHPDGDRTGPATDRTADFMLSLMEAPRCPSTVEELAALFRLPVATVERMLGQAVAASHRQSDPSSSSADSP